MDKFDHIKALSEMSEEEWRFWSKVDTTNNCWIWRSAKNHSGYGLFTYQGKTCLAHRLAYLFATGELLPKQIVLMHTCDTPSCVNPRHLVPGTHDENMQDMATKGRTAGRDFKLTDEDISRIRHLYQSTSISGENLAKEFGITYRYLNVITKGIDRRGSKPRKERIMRYKVRVMIEASGTNYRVTKVFNEFHRSPYGCFDIVIEGEEITSITPVTVGELSEHAVETLIDGFYITDGEVEIISKWRKLPL